jgi:myosin heavy subunit
LGLLLETLNSSHLHYIRCFKPNEWQEPHEFSGGLVLEQMRESGTVALVKIMHHGYPHRCAYQDLQDKFQKSLPEEYQNLDARSFIDLLMLVLNVHRSDYAMGVSKLFLKSGKLAVLEKLLADNSESAVTDEVKAHLRKKKLQLGWCLGHWFVAVRTAPK